MPSEHASIQLPVRIKDTRSTDQMVEVCHFTKPGVSRLVVEWEAINPNLRWVWPVHRITDTGSGTKDQYRQLEHSSNVLKDQGWVCLRGKSSEHLTIQVTNRTVTVRCCNGSGASNRRRRVSPIEVGASNLKVWCRSSRGNS